LALEEVIQNTIQDKYDVDFIRSKEARKKKVDPLLEKIKNLQVASVVKKTRNGFELRDFDKEVFNLMIDFVPKLIKGKMSLGQRSKHYDVFISTDAYGVGVNLQDACVAINYDLAWTPDVIIQRAGRILHRGPIASARSTICNASNL
jgi:hypothetical protein